MAVKEMLKSRVDEPLIPDEEDETLEFARFSGPGTQIYPSPRPEVRDLVLPPMVWVQVDPVFKHSGTFVRDRKAGVFEHIRAVGSPLDLDLSILPNLEAVLDPGQKELIRIIALSPDKELKQEMVDAISIATHIDSATGFARKDSNVTVAYLREHHRPFLMALQDLEKRHQKRKNVLSLVAKQIDLISTLPGK